MNVYVYSMKEMEHTDDNSQWFEFTQIYNPIWSSNVQTPNQAYNKMSRRRVTINFRSRNRQPQLQYCNVNVSQLFWYNLARTAAGAETS